MPFATSQTSRAAMVSLLPEPARRSRPAAAPGRRSRRPARRWARPARAAGRAGPGCTVMAVTCPPSGCTGQQDRTGQTRQPGLAVAPNTGPDIPSATVSTRLAAQPGSASSASARCRCTLTSACKPALPTCTSSAPPGSVRPNRSNAPSSTASWYTPSWGLRSRSASAAGLEPVLRSTMTPAPRSSRSSRSTRPVISTWPIRTRSACSTATSSRGLLRCQARNLVTIRCASSRCLPLYQALPKSR